MAEEQEEEEEKERKEVRKRRRTRERCGMVVRVDEREDMMTCSQCVWRVGLSCFPYSGVEQVM
jgi:hypothetical protein